MQKIDLKSLKNKWPKRQNISHKGSYGHLLIVGGNYQYGGAGILASSGAVYAGAGLVTLATDHRNFTAVRSSISEVMLIDFLDDIALEKALIQATTVVIGPGLGTNSTSLKILNFVLAHLDAKTPLLIDGSALDLVASHDLVLNRHQHLILTPHQMEWQRLSGIKIDQQSPKLNQPVVNQLSATVVLKHYQTEIYRPHQELQVITAGNPGMATGGSGDTLTGIIAALIGQSDDLNLAVTLGTFLHSYTADLIYKHEAVVLPHRLISRLPSVMKQLNNY